MQGMFRLVAFFSEDALMRRSWRSLLQRVQRSTLAGRQSRGNLASEL
jgi:hypothetical protein